MAHRLLLALATIAVFFPVLGNDFVNYDDEVYIIGNALIEQLSWANVKAMFATPHVNGAYTPLVLLSWATDRALFGLNPAGFHGMSLLFHV